MDGNFQPRQKNKAMDVDDFSLTEGTAYFGNEKDFALYMTQMPAHTAEVSNMLGQRS